MAAGVLQKTLPYCRACGWDYVNSDKASDSICDSCGDDLANSGSPVGLLGSSGSTSTPGVADVVFGWTENAAADDTETRSSVDGGAFSPWVSDTTTTTVAGTTGQEIIFEIRSVVFTVSGPVYGPTVQIIDNVL